MESTRTGVGPTAASGAGEFAAKEGDAGGDLGAGQAMEEKGAGDAVLAEEAEVEIVVK